MNELLDNYLESDENAYSNFTDLVVYFNKLALEYLKATDELLSEEMEEVEPYKIDINESIKLTREFLNSINPEYEKILNRTLSDGHFDLFLPEDDLIDRPDYPVVLPGKNLNISIPINNDIIDGAVIVHEFFHYLNDNKTEESVAIRQIFTEMISIYFELRYFQFLVSKGYDSRYFYNEVVQRIDNTYESANNVCMIGSILDIYYNTEKISKKNIRFINRYRKLYDNNITNIIRFYNSKEFIEELEAYDDSMSYLIGTILAFNALGDVKLNDIKMQYINDNVNSYDDIEDVFKVLDVKQNDYKTWINNLKKQLELAMGELYEEDYSDSRTNSSR